MVYFQILCVSLREFYKISDFIFVNKCAAKRSTLKIF